MQSFFRGKTAKTLVYKLANLGFLVVIFISFVIVGCSENSTSPDEGNLFNSGQLSPGETFSFTFEQVQTVEYHCKNHEPDMQGSITVEENAGTADTVTVTMENTQFHPQDETVAPNTTVQWVNEDNVAHTVTSGAPHENSGSGDVGYY